MKVLDLKLVMAYRQQTFRLLPGLRLKSQEDAVAFVKERGYTFFWPINGYILPNLWMAAAGERPVADAHDDPGHVTWRWKDQMLGSPQWYYAKVIRKKATMISMDIAPHFYALSENYGDPETDYLALYVQGRMTQEAKSIYEVLLRDGPMDTVHLRRAAHLTSASSESRFNRALADLQADFKIVPVGVTQSGGWHYSFAYDITARHYPAIPKLAQLITEKDARAILAQKFFLSLGASPIRDLQRLFSWRLPAIEFTIRQLVEQGFLHRELFVDGQAGEWAALAERF